MLGGDALPPALAANHALDMADPTALGRLVEAIRAAPTAQDAAREDAAILYFIGGLGLLVGGGLLGRCFSRGLYLRLRFGLLSWHLSVAAFCWRRLALLRGGAPLLPCWRCLLHVRLLPGVLRCWCLHTHLPLAGGCLFVDLRRARCRLRRRWLIRGHCRRGLRFRRR